MLSSSHKGSFWGLCFSIYILMTSVIKRHEKQKTINFKLLSTQYFNKNVNITRSMTVLFGVRRFITMFTRAHHMALFCSK